MPWWPPPPTRPPNERPPPTCPPPRLWLHAGPANATNPLTKTAASSRDRIPASESGLEEGLRLTINLRSFSPCCHFQHRGLLEADRLRRLRREGCRRPVSYTHLRAHETVLDLVC